MGASSSSFLFGKVKNKHDDFNANEIIAQDDDNNNNHSNNSNKQMMMIPEYLSWFLGVPRDPVSKNQLRKLRKTWKMKSKKIEQISRKKDVKQAINAAKLAEGIPLDVHENNPKRQAIVQDLDVARLRQERKIPIYNKHHIEIVIDMQFEKLMVESDLKSLRTQLSYCNNINKKSIPIPQSNSNNNNNNNNNNAHEEEEEFEVAAAAFKTYVTSASPEFIAMMEVIKASNWKSFEFCQESYMEKFSDENDKKRLVYLTADTEDVLTELEANTIYIIGGLVDHNAHKSICYNMAKEQNIRTARLPISEHMQLASRKVLAVNHVFHILNEYYIHKDWSKALETVMPLRKKTIQTADDED